MNPDEVNAFRRAIEESKVVSSENEEGVSVEVKVLTRSQARVEADLDRNESDAVVEDLWCVVEGEESAQNERGDKLEASVVPVEEGPMQECLREIVDEGDEFDGEPVELDKVV